MTYYEWPPHVPAAKKRAKAARELARFKKNGQASAPVVIEGRAITRTFWGKAWCANLERYSDYSNRLPRGRAYVRNGSVLDLAVAPGEVKALVHGSRVYAVTVSVAALPPNRWKSVRADCSGGIDSLIGFLQGRFSRTVMERLCRSGTGLFPEPHEIKLSCTCPDSAGMCKHIAAALYGIGARLDERPELLFMLRGVDEKELIASAGGDLSAAKNAPPTGKILETRGLSELFGLDIHPEDDSASAAPPKRPRPPRAAASASAGATAKEKRALRPVSARGAGVLNRIVEGEVKALVKAERMKLKGHLEGLVHREVKKALRRFLR